MLPFVHSELPFMHRGIEKYKDFVIFKVYYYILSILRIYNMEWWTIVNKVDAKKENIKEKVKF